MHKDRTMMWQVVGICTNHQDLYQKESKILEMWTKYIRYFHKFCKNKPLDKKKCF